jgi:hypothetical protein
MIDSVGWSKRQALGYFIGKNFTTIYKKHWHTTQQHCARCPK